MKNLSRLLLLAALAPAAYSQSVLYTFNGDSKGDWCGYSVSGAGDVNGDGCDDLIVGYLQFGFGSGYARVFSGLDGSILHTFSGFQGGANFGYSVSGAGDVNGDGYDDLIVGDDFDSTNGSNSGSARVFSGLDGSILYTFLGDSVNDFFGYSVSGAGDVNGDGYDDLIVSAVLNNDANIGSVRVFSGLDGSILYTIKGNSAGDVFGNSVSGAGDVNGDGFADFIVGVPFDDNNGGSSGSAQVFSGLDGSILYIFDGDSGTEYLGWSVSGAGDVNGDGFQDLIVGIPGGSVITGTARVFSGLDGSILYTFDGESPNGSSGHSVGGAGDVNGDGYDDLIVGAYWDDNNGKKSGSIRVFSGADGKVLYRVNGDSPADEFGFSVSGAGDVNGDGYDDLIVGARWDDNNGDMSGSARVLSGGEDIGTNYCGPAIQNSTGQAALISAFGSTTATTNLLTLVARQLPKQVFGYFINSDVQGFTPLPPGSSGNLCLGGVIGRHAKQVATSGGAGRLVIDVDLTVLPRPNGTHSVVAGETWNFQCWFRDNQGGKTSNFTDGIEIVFL